MLPVYLRILTMLIGKKLSPSSSDLNGFSDFSPVKVLSNELDFNNYRWGGEMGRIQKKTLW